LHAYLLQDGSHVEVDGPPPLPWGVLEVSLGDLGIS
jgi:hypothetical protein